MGEGDHGFGEGAPQGRAGVRIRGPAMAGEINLDITHKYRQGEVVVFGERGQFFL
jgi:hypothetical protein